MIVPPNSIEAEQSLLAGLLQIKDASEILVKLKDADFYKEQHRLIYKAIQQLAGKGQPHDVVTVTETLESTGAIDYAGGMPYLIEITNLPATKNLDAYAKIIKEKAVLRNLLNAVMQISDNVYHPDGMNSDAIIERAYDALRLIDTQTDSDIPSIDETILSAIHELEFRHENAGKITGVQTGFEKLDEMTMGLQRGELYVIGGRPAMGKSTLALNISVHAALEGKHVLFFSLEMPKERVVDKSISSIGSVPYSSIKTGNMDSDVWGRASHAMMLLRESGLRIDDRGGQTLQSIIMKCKKLDTKRKLDLIVIDYMQLIRIEKMNRFDEVSEVSRQLKALAKNLDVPVIALSQLNRGLENRPDKRPRLADIRESGQIEQDADLIAFIYRDEVYYPDSQTNKHVAELLIEKNRFGETGKIYLTSELWFSRFKNLQNVSYAPYQSKKSQSEFAE